ncbi:MAG TPA: type VI secretion system baseplate subunit TssG [Bacteroidia bacterium]|nr:type VI secretion system baseplate subunit TssG [Bacteroidia bacterium]
MEQDQLIEKVKSLLHSIPLDLRVEVVVTDLLKSGYSLDDFFVRPVGIFKRRFGKDISKVERVELQNNSEIYNIEINREGFYDMLPQGLFHNPPGKGTKAFKKASEMAEEVKIRKKEEREARDFFHIYEIELYYQRLAVEWHERSLIETISITMDDEDFLSYWELPSVFNKQQKGILFYLYPVIDSIRGNVSLMEKTYSLVLDEKVSMNIMQMSTRKMDSVKGFNLIGKGHLGLDLVLGSSATPVYQTLMIEVGPVSNQNLLQYLPRGRNWMVMNELNRFFLPLFIEYKSKIIAEKGEWKLGSEKAGTRLGWNVSL